MTGMAVYAAVALVVLAMAAVIALLGHLTACLCTRQMARGGAARRRPAGKALSQAYRGTIAVPDEFHLALAPIEDCDHYRVRARFRYRLADGQLLLGYHLGDPAGKLRQAVSEIVEKTEHACGVTIMRGTP